MEKKFNLKISARINENAKTAIDVLSFNQLVLRSEVASETKKFHLDKIYSVGDKNEKLFENILRVPLNLLLEGLSSMVLCLGSPNSGKTYTLAGKMNRSYSEELNEPGILIYLMRRLFSKFKHEVSLYSTYSFWCRFYFIEHDKIIDLNSDEQQAENLNNECIKIEIKSYSHFEEIISTIYTNNDNKRHTIVELILQKQSKQTKKLITSSITFIEFGSFFYNCPYRQAEELSIENDIQSVLHVIKNLSRTKENSMDLFESSLLAKVLKNNFLTSTSFELIGLLDESYQNNLKTLSFLEIIMNRKHDQGLAWNVREQIKREELYLKSLYQKHRKVLNLLSRCIGMELGSLEKQKKNRGFDGPILNTFYKTCEKIKFANQKKLQNQKTMEEIQKLIEKQKQQVNEIESEYEKKYEQIEEKKKQLESVKTSLEKKYQNIVNPAVKFSNNDKSLYWRADDVEVNVGNKHHQEEDQGPGSVAESERQSRGQKSLKFFSSNVITSRKNIPTIQTTYKRDKQDRYERNQKDEQTRLAGIRLAAIKQEVGKLFELIGSQQKQINKYQSSIPLHNHLLLNRIKLRHQHIKFDLKAAEKCYVSWMQQKQNKGGFNESEYKNTIENMKIQQKIQKELFNNNSMNAISTKSLKSEKQIKM